MLRRPTGPQRIVCLTEEPTEILYALGESSRIVGITAYTMRPQRAREEKPIVSAFIGGSIEKICALKPDLVIGFSDVQAEYARSLIAHGLPVLIFNQRSLDEILEVILTISRIVGAEAWGLALVDSYLHRLDEIGRRSAELPYRPKVYFEEWDEPMITAIRWVSELISIAGGDPLFPEKSMGAAAKERYVSVEAVQRAAPDLILASWCGKKVDISEIHRRLGPNVPAVRRGQVFEVASEIILQPGPACLTDGVDELADRVRTAAQIG